MCVCVCVCVCFLSRRDAVNLVNNVVCVALRTVPGSVCVREGALCECVHSDAPLECVHSDAPLECVHSATPLECGDSAASLEPLADVCVSRCL